MGAAQSDNGNDAGHARGLGSDPHTGSGSKQTTYLADVTTVPDRYYTDDELLKMESFLTKIIEKLDKQIRTLAANDGAGFTKIYQNIKAGINNSADASRQRNNIKLNRYTNIVAYDHSRVKVQDVGPHVGDTDYINANFVDGYKRKNMYIASQGPVPDSFNAYWQMIWEQDVRILVMVTNEVEGGKLKCHRYWPDQLEGSVIMGKIKITHSFQEVQPTFIVRYFTIEHIPTQQTRDIVQFAYTAWPDHGVPNTTKEMLQFRTTIHGRDVGKSPVLVHCSAGVGRTGTYIAIDRFLDGCADLYSKETILDIVNSLREARNYMVQSQIQFNYLHSAIFDGVAALLMRVQRERHFRGLNPDQRRDEELHELEAEIIAADDAFLKRVRVDARYWDQVDKEKELETAKKVSLQKRKGSLMIATQPTESWANPADELANAETIEARLQALVSMQGNARRQSLWQAEEYNLKENLSPLESRIQSLVYAEDAWRSRSLQSQGTGDGRTALEELHRQNLAAITQRLDSLQQTVTHGEQRWRARLSRDESSTKADTAGHRRHTTDLLGSLTDRLQKLQQDETEWAQRGSWKKFSVDQFREDVVKERRRLAEVIQQQNEAEAAAAKKQTETLTAAEKREQEEQTKRAAMAAEEIRKTEIRTAIKRKSVVETFFDPQAVRDTKVRKAEEEALKKAEAQAKKEAEAAAKVKAAEEKKNSKAAAKAKADAFLRYVITKWGRKQS